MSMQQQGSLVQDGQSAALAAARDRVGRFCRLMHARSAVQTVVAEAAAAVRLRRLAAALRSAGAAVAERRLQAAHHGRTAAMCRGIAVDIAAAAAARAAFPALVRRVIRRRVEAYARRVVVALADAAVCAAAVREDARVAAGAAVATERWVADVRAGRVAAERAAMRRWVRRLVVALGSSAPALSRHQVRLAVEGVVDDLIAMVTTGR